MVFYLDDYSRSVSGPLYIYVMKKVLQRSGHHRPLWAVCCRREIRKLPFAGFSWLMSGNESLVEVVGQSASGQLRPIMHSR